MIFETHKSNGRTIIVTEKPHLLYVLLQNAGLASNAYVSNTNGGFENCVVLEAENFKPSLPTRINEALARAGKIKADLEFDYSDTSGHLFNGGTGITNMSQDRIIPYLLAMDDFPSELFIGKAMPPCTNWEGYYALRSASHEFPENVSEFWSLVEKYSK